MANDEWKDWELGKLWRLYRDPDVSIDEVDRQLPKRTKTAIRLKASREGISRIREAPDNRSSLSGLSWRIHYNGDRQAVVEMDLTLQEAMKYVMDSKDDLAATGYQAFKPIATIHRAE